MSSIRSLFWKKIAVSGAAYRWLFLPFLSTLFLIGSSYPFRIWPLGFIALVPLIFLIERNPREYRKIVWSGFLVGFLYPMVLMYATVMEFTWLPEAYFFQSVIRWMSLPIAFLIGLLYAGALLLYAKKLRTASLVKNIFIFAFVWTLAEWLITKGTGGYNLGILAHVVATLPFFTSLAALGGIHFVSFLVILCNSFIGFFITAFIDSNKRLLLKRYSLVAAGTIGIVVVLFLGNAAYLRHGQIEQSVTVAVLQNSDRKQGAFGTFASGTFSFDKLSALVRDAQNAEPSPDVVLYPFAVSKEILATATSSSPYVATAPLSEFSDWVSRTAGNTTLVTWNTFERGGMFFNEIDYWDQGRIVSAYQKKNLFPFMDYTPLWAQHIGLYSTVVDEVPGEARQSLFELGAARIASAVCSEINSPMTIRDNVRQANIAFSIGSDAMFSDSFAAESDLVSAQFRAAENNVALVRANRFGPSGFIAPDGRIIQKTNPGEDGAFIATVPYEMNPRTTLYQMFGDWPLIGFSIGILFAITYKRFASRLISSLPSKIS